MTSAASDALAALRRDLAQPPVAADLATTAALWSVDTARFVCRRPPLMEDYPELSIRVRGAFGRALHALPMRPTWRGGPRPRAYDVLFAPLGTVGGDELPKPAIIRAAITGDQVVVDLLVLGFAQPWFEEAAVALAHALSAGIALTAEGRQRAPFDIIDCGERRIAYIEPSASASLAVLRFRTPVIVRYGERLTRDPRAILRTLPRRVAAMARWQGIALAYDHAPVAQAVAETEIDDSDLDVHRWCRGSARSGKIPVHGWLGRLIVRGNLAPLLPFLALAEACNTGSHASIGCGWFELITTP
jgi:CRISPR-associated endoribonuclease Cas6